MNFFLQGLQFDCTLKSRLFEYGGWKMEKKVDLKLIKALCKPEMLVMGPIKARTVDMISAVHLSPRRMFSFPNSLETVCKALSQVVKKIDPDVVAGGEASGIPLATLISIYTGIPFIYVRKTKIAPPRFSVEGVMKKGAKVVLIDDAIASGGSKITFIENIEAAGGIVTDLVCIFDWVITDKGEPAEEEGRKYLEEKGVKIHSLINAREWYRQMYLAGYLSEKMFLLVDDFNRDMLGWQGDEAKWEEFNKVKELQSGGFV